MKSASIDPTASYPRDSGKTSNVSVSSAKIGTEIRAALLTNFIPPYYVTVLQRLAERVGDLSILASIPMEPNRPWEPLTGGLNVFTQKTITLPYRCEHEIGFSDQAYIHIPYDLLFTLRRLRPDVVISAQLGFRSLQAALYRKLNPRSRLILWTYLSEHTEAGIGRTRTFLRRLLLSFADAVLVDGASGARYLRSLGVPSESFFYLPYTIDISPFLSVPITRQPPTARRLIYFGQLIERKGLLPFLRALSRWLSVHPDERCEMWIVGDGPVRAHIEGTQWPYTLSLRFFGNVPYDALPQLYAQAGVLAFPTLADEWGVVVNEALAAGLPVLGSRYSQAVEELIADGVNGWTFRANHPEEIHAALDRMMTASLGQLEEMRQAGRRRLCSITPEYGANCFLQAIEYVHPPGGQFRLATERRIGKEVAHGKVEDLLQ